MQIEKQTFLVTGGGSVLGAATAKMITANGGNVLIADVSDAGAKLATELGARAAFQKSVR